MFLELSIKCHNLIPYIFQPVSCEDPEMEESVENIELEPRSNTSLGDDLLSTLTEEIGSFSYQAVEFDGTIMEAVLPADLPTESTILVGYIEEGSTSVTLVYDGDSPLVGQPGDDLTDSVGTNADTLVFFIAGESPEDVNSVVESLENGLSVKICGKFILCKPQLIIHL